MEAVLIYSQSTKKFHKYEGSAEDWYSADVPMNAIVYLRKENYPKPPSKVKVTVEIVE